MEEGDFTVLPLMVSMVSSFHQMFNKSLPVARVTALMPRMDASPSRMPSTLMGMVRWTSCAVGCRLPMPSEEETYGKVTAAADNPAAAAEARPEARLRTSSMALPIPREKP